MFDWSLLNFLWLILAGFCFGFGWKVGHWLADKIFKP